MMELIAVILICLVVVMLTQVVIFADLVHKINVVLERLEQ